RPQPVVVALARAGKSVEAYGKSPTDDVFRFTAEELSQAGRDDELRRLIQSRRVNVPDDPLAALFAGRLRDRAGKYPEAVAEYERARRGLVGEKLREAEAAYVQAVARLGRGSVAWWRMGRPRYLVPALRGALAAQKRGAELERLAAHLRAES